MKTDNTSVPRWNENETTVNENSATKPTDADLNNSDANSAKTSSAPVNTIEVAEAKTDVNSADVKKSDSAQPKQEEKARKERSEGKKKKKRNLWPLKVLIISFVLAFAVNAGSELLLEDAHLWLAIVLTIVILALGVIFDMIGTAANSCDVQPFLAMASRKVKGAKMAVKLSQKCDVVSSVCCDVVGDICGIVSGVCAATIAVQVAQQSANTTLNFWVSVLIYAAISTATISLKAVGKRLSVNKANSIIFGVAKMLSLFSKKK